MEHKETNLLDKCQHCKKKKTILGHDRCFANLPGVYFACCGHGDISKAYLTTNDGIIAGYEAFVYASMNRPSIIDIVKIHVKSAKLTVWVNYWNILDILCRKTGYTLTFHLGQERTWHTIRKTL